MAQRKRKPPQSMSALLRRYKAGERDFAGARPSPVIVVDDNFEPPMFEGVILAEANLSYAHFYCAMLNRADFTKANLSYANLREVIANEVNLTVAILIGTDFCGAELMETDLRDSNISKANFSDANLAGANFTAANLSNADLSNASLEEVNFSRANLHDARLDGAQLNRSILVDIDLSAFCDADPPVKHNGPSPVDFRAVAKSIRSPRLKGFLRQTGMPEVFVEYMIDCARTLVPLGVFRMLQSTFISYGSPDESFARKLYEALQRNGVTTFFFAEHARGGQKLRRMMSRGINDHDQVILVCSRRSLKRPGVLNEVEEVLQREARDGGREYLIPIRLDDYVFTGWKPREADTARAVKDRVILDFVGADTDATKFDAGLQRLISALKK